MYLLTSFKVVATIVLVYILISLIEAGEAKLAEDLFQVKHVEFVPIGNNKNEEIIIDEGFVIFDD